MSPEAHLPWRLWQLADSAFPTGGFAHSAGLEAALQQGEVVGIPGLENYLREALGQAGHGALPLVSSAHRGESNLRELDLICDAFLNNAIANRASRVQGRTFLATCVQSFETAKIRDLAGQLKQPPIRCHYAPVFGVTLCTLGIELAQTQRLFLHFTLRGMISAAIRLGLVGPYEAQRIQDRFGTELEQVLSRCARLGWQDLAQTAPLLDIFQANHDRLYSRLFQS